MQVAVFHPGTQHSRQTALALQDLGRLAFLATSLYPAGFLAQALKRYAVPGLDPALVRRHGLAELAERAAARLGALGLARRIDAWGNARFGRWVADEAAKEKPLALWGFSGSARTAFEDPRLAGSPRLLDRTIGDWRRWNRELASIRETHAHWLDASAAPVSETRIAADEAEYAAATRILCPSPFVAETIAAESALLGIAAKLELLPYGFDQRLFGNAPEPATRPASEPVRFLFAGQVSARKGAQHLLEAAARIPLSQARITLAGPRRVPEAALAPYTDRIDWLGPVAQSELPAIMQAHDVLVLPSHFEGSALVLLEALASGLAIIATPQAGLGPTPASGIAVERPDAALVEEAMLELIADPERLMSMRRAAQFDAARHDFAGYRDTIAGLLARLEI